MSTYTFSVTRLDSCRWRIDVPGAQPPQGKRASAAFDRAAGTRRKVCDAAIRGAIKAGADVVVIRGHMADGSIGTLDAFPVDRMVGNPCDFNVATRRQVRWPGSPGLGA